MNKQSNQLKKSISTPHVGLDGEVYQIQRYNERLKNYQLIPYIIESLANDLQFNAEWMVDLDQNWKNLQNKTSQYQSLIGFTHIITGPALCGKFGYVFLKKQRDYEVKIVRIDCIYNHTVTSFVSQLVDQIAMILQKPNSSKLKKAGSKAKLSQSSISDTQQLSKRIVIQNQVNLKELDKHIKSKPNIKFLIVIKNAQKLVEQKKQTILYNLLEWIKTDIRTQIGLVFIVRAIDFTGDKMEKRVRSRLNAKTITLFGPSSQKVVKQALIKRFQFSLKTIEETLRNPMMKFIKLFQKSTKVDKKIKQQLQRSPKQIPFFLQFFKLIFCLGFEQKNMRTLTNSSGVGAKQLAQFEQLFLQGYQEAMSHICPYSERQKVIFRQMNYPQFILMGIIRKMLLDQKPKITFKEIKKQIASFRVNNYTRNGNSFEFTDRLYEKTIENLRKLRIIDVWGNRDFQNAQIICNLLPKDIKQAVQSRDDVPSVVRQLYI